MKSMFYVIVILLSLFMMLLEIILSEGNMVIKFFMSLKHLSLCFKVFKLLLFYVPMLITMFFVD